MLNPGTAYDDPKIGTDPQPANMKSFINTTRDNGGVHLNSGIPNKAFATFATEVGGNAWEAPGKIWYQARANAGSEPSFANFAYQTIQAAKQLGFTSDLPKLQKAWDAVGVKPSAAHASPTRLSFIPFFSNTDDKKAA
jgi:Zn-dependent metalloprotease